MLSVEKQILYLISRTESLSAKDLIRIYEGRGIGSQIVRNALARLKKERYADATARSMYAATELGREYVASINGKPRQYERQWDGNWYFVMFEIPETERKKRDGFRTDLVQLGYGGVYKGVYASPWEYTEEVLRLGAVHEVLPYLSLTKGEYLHNPVTSGQAREIWGLEEVERLYEEKRDWFDNVFLPSLRGVEESEPEYDLRLFLKFLELGDVIAELGLRDPMLPAELLPDDWTNGGTIARFNETLRRIADRIPKESSYRRFVV
ncbi:PaaX family transcriptional regulator C-terminal domain-containing protein [Cohnella cholangitidis]|uniref:PaaX family transcriptional regulator n=1 Tax=Cohnella cholangitidis TaxID=2598458 RepID=A0A7G5C007_9BACL|nr:PaaX family transcriptional regulator C-terminal domain-containing protein [Cohnella cholangitidis]QMV42541.1 PaaX family transcriptional regulator [Cohnella cholangitidis]